MGVQVLPTDFKGPLPEGTVGLLIGRSSSALKGLIIHPGVIDSDYTGTVKVLTASPRGITAISPGDRIAQLLLLPSLHAHFPAVPVHRGEKSLGSSGGGAMYLALDLERRPMLTLNVNGKNILGLLDTGADRSIIAIKDWPKGWPVQESSQTLQGLGYAKTPNMSSRVIPWKDDEGHSGEFQPYVLELPISLWGRDLLQALNLTLTDEKGICSKEARKIMTSMGWHPSHGLGRYLQGRRDPVVQESNPGKKGLDFS